MNYSKDQEKDDNGYSKVVSRSGYCSEDFSDGGGKYSSDDDDDDDGEIGDGKTICAAQETNNIQVVPDENYNEFLGLGEPVDIWSDNDIEKEIKAQIMGALLTKSYDYKGGMKASDIEAIFNDIANKLKSPGAADFTLEMIMDVFIKDSELLSKCKRNKNIFFQLEIFDDIMRWDQSSEVYIPTPRDQYLQEIQRTIEENSKRAYEKKIIKKDRHQEEAEKPENKMRYMQACNMFMEIIAKVTNRRCESQVDWNYIRDEYNNASEENSLCHSIYNKYHNALCLDDHPTINNTAFKHFSGRSGLVKALCTTVYSSKIDYHEEKPKPFRISLKDTSLYTEKEISDVKKEAEQRELERHRRYEPRKSKKKTKEEKEQMEINERSKTFKPIQLNTGEEPTTPEEEDLYVAKRQKAPIKAESTVASRLELPPIPQKATFPSDSKTSPISANRENQSQVVGEYQNDQKKSVTSESPQSFSLKHLKDTEKPTVLSEKDISKRDGLNTGVPQESKEEKTKRLEEYVVSGKNSLVPRTDSQDRLPVEKNKEDQQIEAFIPYQTPQRIGGGGFTDQRPIMSNEQNPLQEKQQELERLRQKREEEEAKVRKEKSEQKRREQLEEDQKKMVQAEEERRRQKEEEERQRERKERVARERMERELEDKRMQERDRSNQEKVQEIRTMAPSQREYGNGRGFQENQEQQNNEREYTTYMHQYGPRDSHRPSLSYYHDDDPPRDDSTFSGNYHSTRHYPDSSRGQPNYNNPRRPSDLPGPSTRDPYQDNYHYSDFSPLYRPNSPNHHQPYRMNNREDLNLNLQVQNLAEAALRRDRENPESLSLAQRFSTFVTSYVYAYKDCRDLLKWSVMKDGICDDFAKPWEIFNSQDWHQHVNDSCPHVVAQLKNGDILFFYH